jgi:predicted phage-related endonuclease
MTAKHEATVMQSPITYHDAFDQGSEQWLQARCGLLTASTIGRLITPTGKLASNDKSRALEWELLAQRISNYVEPQYIGDAMLRGQEEEIYARLLYAEKIAPVRTVALITNERLGFKLGYSPDGLVGDDGLIECKSRAQRFQVETIITDEVPAEYVPQIQCGLFVTERKWLDFLSYSNGLPMMVARVEPCPIWQETIQEAACEFERRLSERLAIYQDKLARRGGLFPTERIKRDMVI